MSWLPLAEIMRTSGGHTVEIRQTSDGRPLEIRRICEMDSDLRPGYGTEIWYWDLELGFGLGYWTGI